MNNYRLLNIINPQFIYNIDCGQDKNNNKYMVVIPALVGYDKNVACSLYLTISEKLLDESSNMKLEQLINDMQEDIMILFQALITIFLRHYMITFLHTFLKILTNL